MKNAFRLLVVAGLLSLFVTVSPAADSKFDFATLRARAQQLATKPHQPPRSEVPDWLRRLTYDELRLIEFLGQYSLWFPEKLKNKA